MLVEPEPALFHNQFSQGRALRVFFLSKPVFARESDAGEVCGISVEVFCELIELSWQCLIHTARGKIQLTFSIHALRMEVV